MLASVQADKPASFRISDLLYWKDVMNNSIHLEDDSMCYACGKKNEKGLHLTFAFSEKEKSVETKFMPSEAHQGWKGIVHGGIIATLMDEAMAKLVHFMGYHAVTASLDVRYKSVAKTLEALTVKAEVSKVAKRLIYTKAIASAGDGKVVAEASAKLMVY
jgi:acyl-coenzyme A thioesterase PaaI-like protein